MIMSNSYSASPCCTDRGCRRTEPYPCSGLCDADVLRASQPQHSVQHADSDGHLARLSPVRLEAQPVTDDALPSRDVSLHQSAPVVARGFLPSHAAVLGNGLEMLVALRRCALCGVAWHRVRAWRHHDGRVGMAYHDLGVDGVAVVGTVASDGRHCPLDPLEQGTDL